MRNNTSTIGSWSPAYSSPAYPAYASGMGSYYYFSPSEIQTIIEDTDDKG